MCVVLQEEGGARTEKWGGEREGEDSDRGGWEKVQCQKNRCLFSLSRSGADELDSLVPSPAKRKRETEGEEKAIKWQGETKREENDGEVGNTTTESERENDEREAKAHRGLPGYWDGGMENEEGDQTAAVKTESTSSARGASSFFSTKLNSVMKRRKWL
jgi:hypothetical protein